jgi:hypothetical protein
MIKDLLSIIIVVILLIVIAAISLLGKYTPKTWRP